MIHTKKYSVCLLSVVLGSATAIATPRTNGEIEPPHRERSEIRISQTGVATDNAKAMAANWHFVGSEQEVVGAKWIGKNCNKKKTEKSNILFAESAKSKEDQDFLRDIEAKAKAIISRRDVDEWKKLVFTGTPPCVSCRRFSCDASAKSSNGERFDVQITADVADGKVQMLKLVVPAQFMADGAVFALALAEDVKLFSVAADLAAETYKKAVERFKAGQRLRGDDVQTHRTTDGILSTAGLSYDMEFFIVTAVSQPPP